MLHKLFSSDLLVPSSCWQKWDEATSQLASVLSISAFRRISLCAMVWGISIYKWCLMSLIAFLIFTDMIHAACLPSIHFPPSKDSMFARICWQWHRLMLCSIQWCVMLFGQWHLFYGSILATVKSHKSYQVNILKALLDGAPPWDR